MAKEIDRATTAALITLSGGLCYRPGCGEPVVRFVEEDVPVLHVDRAHICSRRPDGARYDPTMTDEQRNSFSNVILLCRDDHRLVDGKRWARYPVSLLQEWKAQREGPNRPVLARLGAISEERLEELITEAMKQREGRILDAIDELREIDQESAQILRGLLDEVHDLRSSGPIIDPDTAQLLVQAGNSLRHINSDLPVLIESAADRLQQSINQTNQYM